MTKQTNPFQKTARKCVNLLDIAVNAMIKQGDGCYNDMGAAYKTKNRKDVISALCAGNIIGSHLFRPIGDYDMRKIVTHIITRHQMDPNQRPFIVNFLQQLQDAHDNAFDPFNRVEGNRMDEFKAACTQIRYNLSKI